MGEGDYFMGKILTLEFIYSHPSFLDSSDVQFFLEYHPESNFSHTGYFLIFLLFFMKYDFNFHHYYVHSLLYKYLEVAQNTKSSTDFYTKHYIEITTILLPKVQTWRISLIILSHL